MTFDDIHQTKIHSKIAGVTFEERQSIVKQLKVGDTLILEREPTNIYDKNAIKVLLPDKRHVGYINKTLARDLSEAMDRKNNYSCFVSGITGQTHDSYGCNIIIAIDNKEVNLDGANKQYNIT